jgi:hypothetical protein
MFRIHKIFDVTTPTNRQLLSQVQAMLRVQFDGLSEKDIAKLPSQLANPMKFRFRSILLVAEDGNAIVRGFAMLQHAPDLNFCYLDYVCAGETTIQDDPTSMYPCFTNSPGCSSITPGCCDPSVQIDAALFCMGPDIFPSNP